MKVIIESKNENKLMKRIEVVFTVEHEKAPTPTRKAVEDQLAALLGKGAEVVIAVEIQTVFGGGKSKGVAHVYASEAELRATEPAYLQKRSKPQKAPEVKNE